MTPPGFTPNAKRPIASDAKAPHRGQVDPIGAPDAEPLPTETRDDYLEPDAIDADPRLEHRKTSEETELDGSTPSRASER